MTATVRNRATIEKDDVVLRRRELLPTQQQQVLHPHAVRQLSQGGFILVCRDVRHQRQVFHQTTSLTNGQWRDIYIYIQNTEKETSNV